MERKMEAAGSDWRAGDPGGHHDYAPAVNESQGLEISGLDLLRQHDGSRLRDEGTLVPLPSSAAMPHFGGAGRRPKISQKANGFKTNLTNLNYGSCR